MDNIKEIYRFLAELKQNNNREWFKDNKERYDTLRKAWLEDVQYIIDKMSVYDPSLIGVNAPDCVYRIYRDIRFSKNKTPYKTYFGAVIGIGGRKCPFSCYYLHIEPGCSGLFGGVWCPQPNELKALRHAIDDNIEEWEEILDNPEIKSKYALVGESLKTAPKGFEKDLPHINYLKMKQYILQWFPKEDYFFEPDWKDKVAEDFRCMGGFHRFINFTLQEEL